MFEGGHTWLSSELATEAIEWMEIQAMSSGMRPPDQALVDDVFKRRTKRADGLANGLARMREWQSIARDFRGLKNVSELDQRAAALSAQADVKAALDAERADAEREDGMRAKVAALLEDGDTSSGLLPIHLSRGPGDDSWQNLRAHAGRVTSSSRFVQHSSDREGCMSRTSLRCLIAFVPAAALWLWTTAPVAGQVGANKDEWRTYGGDLANRRYSSLDQINAGNFSKLEVAWRFKTDNFGPRPEFNLQGTPLMVNGVLYAPAGTRRAVVALDAATGELLWLYSLNEGKRQKPPHAASQAGASRTGPTARQSASSTSRLAIS